ncbi:SusC/RagA family TonB-linked outer membrane protein [Cyclobacterium marinum]|uniref:TonB-dependent receptor plug n=1 Tax=Cyclobacterium marinum (strain ATCC 25205 / DSM 745 / LMG 13164 / NCIMB 1802) TaxID=880070 RepID=G0IXF8_CYCMS|nr:TonB-dependent receptor [Cyclobacterium marinum]AEL27147.1 TonB-dependent receptor plug [Cyclobacterium marinum DSM 745]MBI0400387.1 TonB-dependent receptor [Cyclobacterium marinum]|tara:strand:- start:8981 stop:12244 length:3264 start_codon:yes stop_codon:yes gene_type:complete
MKKSLHFYRAMQPMSWLPAILFCLFSVGLKAQTEGLDKNLENIQKVPTELASAKIINADADITVSGTVTDENGMPIPGATVSVPGTNIGTATDLDGKFSLTVDENAEIVFSFIGFESQTVNVGNRSTINITLKEDTQSLDEVVVVGYGTQEKVNLTGAVGVATSERLQNRPIANVGEGLQGVIPNLNIAPQNGDPSQSPSFNIRGYQSINGGSPLILVDNVPMDLNRINPNDIESVSVLKDASAAAVYGARAAFGVVLVTTKSGKAGKVRVSLNSQFSLGKPIFNMDPITDPYRFVQARNLANERTNGRPAYDQDMIDGTKRWSENPTEENAWGVVDGNLRFYGFNNYQDQIMTEFAPSQQHDLSISGGSENSKYFVSIGHLNKDGYLNSDRNENFKRYNVLMKGEFKVTDWLTLDEKIVINSQQSDKPYFYNWDVNINSLARVNPIMPISFPDLPYYVTEGDRETYAPYIGMYFGGTNFFPYLEDGGRSTWTNNDIWLTQGVTLTPAKGLTIKSNFSYNFFHRSEQNVASKIEIVDTNLLADGLISNGFSGNDFIDERASYNQYYVFNAYADYKFDLPEVHSLTTMVGFNQEWGQNKLIRAQANTLLTPLITDLNATTGLQQTFGSSSHVSLRGAFYRVNYIFDERFLLEANGRYDGTSRFPSDSRFGFFPSFSAGYRISNEAWMAGTKNWMDELKIRASYGTLGNQLLGSNYYPYIPTLGTGQSGFMMSAGQRTPYVSAAGLVSPTLTWETVVSQNIGVDVTLFGGKIDASFDVYSRETKDMLMRQEYPSILGTNAPQSNAADLRTTGWELALTWKDQVNNDLNYDVTLALSDWTAEITKFINPEGVISQYYVGQKLGEIWGYETVGIFQSQEEVDNAPDQSRLGANWRAGDIQYADLNGDGIISPGNNTLSDPGDRKIIGNETPRLSFGLNNNFQWKNFTLNLFFQGIWKRDHWPTSGNWTWFFPFNAGHVEEYFITDSWSEDNRDAYFAAPHISTNDKKNILTQSRFLQNAGYIRLKNMNLGYNLPQNWMETIGFQNANIYFSGMNLWEYSPIRKPLDPETIYSGAIEYPMQRVYTLGARITF